MPESDTSYEELAKAFMERWQQQVSNAAGDRELVNMMLEMAKTMPFSAMAPGMYAAQGKDGDTTQRAAAASGADDATMAELARRLAYCEARIARLEGQLADAGRPSAPGRSASAGKHRKGSAKKKPDAT